MEASLPPSYRPDQAKRFLANKLVAEASATGVSNLREQYESPLALLLAATGLVLLIACANLANLLLARASVREREMAVRQAIGASRGRLIVQLLSESLLLAVLGTALGVALAQVLSRALIAFLSTENNPVFVGLALDLRMLGFTAAMAIGTCLLFGLLPALRATRIAPAAAMRAGGRGTTAGRERYGLRRALVTAQVALSLVLLVGALLFVRSLQKLLDVQPGFRPEGVVAVNIDISPGEISQRAAAHGVWRPVGETARPARRGCGRRSRHDADQRIRLERERAARRVHRRSQELLLQSLRTGLSQDDGNIASGGPRFRRAGHGRRSQSGGGERGLRQALLRRAQPGRPHVPRGGGSRKARSHLPDRGSGAEYQVLRTARGVHPNCVLADRAGREPGKRYDVGGAHRRAGRRTRFRTLKSAVAAVNPGFVLEFHVMTVQIEESLLRDRLMAVLAGAFGVLASVLAAIGLYGVIAYMVARRQNEIGVRMALGADRASVVRLVLREAMMLLAAGLVIGVGLALWAGRAAATLLFGLKPNDAATFVVASVLLAVVAAAAGYVPARRASGMDPMDALRVE